jgi:hypothetical protein
MRHLMLVLVLIAPAYAVEQSATVTKVEKRVEVQKPGAPWTPATVDMKLSAGDQIHTGFKAIVALKFADGSVVEVKPMTIMKLATVEQNGNTVSTKLQLRVGEVSATVGDSATLSSDFKVQTATCTASVRGTIIQRIAYSEATGTTVSMGPEGRLVVQTVTGEVSLGQNDTVGVASATDNPDTPDQTRTAESQAAPGANLTDTEQAAADSLGVPKVNPLTEGGASLSGTSVMTVQNTVADMTQQNAANETLTGVDQNGNGVVDAISGGTRLRAPPFVTLPTIPGVVRPPCCP